MKSLIHWYKGLKSINRLLLTYLFNFTLWFVVQQLKHWFLAEAYDETMGKDLFMAIWMGILWTLLFSWSLVKETFKREQK